MWLSYPQLHQVLKRCINRFIYGVTKGCLKWFISFSNRLCKTGIRCNGILPGTVETPSWQGRVNMAEDPKKLRRILLLDRQWVI